MGCCPSGFMARSQGHKPPAALRGQRGKFCVRRCAYFRTNNWPSCPAGCCSLVLGPLHFISHHLGRTVQTPDGEDLGSLVSQRIVSTAGIRSITTTTEKVIKGDGTEKYLVAPKPAD